MQKQIDMARYNYDVNESFGNIDITSCTEGGLTNDETLSNAIKSNCEEVSSFVENDKENKDRKEDLEKILDAMDIEKDKISNTLFDIQTYLSTSKEAKSTIENSITKLYEKMRYANEKLPFCQSTSSWALGNLEKDTNVDSQRTIYPSTEQFLTPSSSNFKSPSNNNYQKQKLLMVGGNNIGK